MAAIQTPCNIKHFRMLTPTVFELKFEPETPFEFEPGQFVSVIVPGAGPQGRDLRRAYSIASSPEQRPIELCVKLVEKGPGTNYLIRLRPGDAFKGVAPYGDFVFEPKPGRHCCLISTGTGIAPFRSMVLSRKFAENLPTSTLLLLGVRHENELLYTDELDRVEGVKYVTAVSRPESPDYAGFRGRVTDYLRTLGADYPWRETEFYLCGGSAMIDEVKTILAGYGVEKTSIHQEIYYKEPKPS
jgi:NAD(P)H-flavin reductase